MRSAVVVLMLLAGAWLTYAQVVKPAPFQVGPWRCVSVGDGSHVGDRVVCTVQAADAKPPWLMVTTNIPLGLDCRQSPTVRANGLAVRRQSDGTVVQLDVCAVAEEDGPFRMGP